MTKNTLAAALMAALFAILAGWLWLSLYHPIVAVAAIAVPFVSTLAYMAWKLFQDLAEEIIEARRKRGEGNHDAQ